MSLQLTEALQLKKISFLDSVFENQSSDDSGFDTDVAIATGELTRLLPDLIAALGGEGRSAGAGVGTGAGDASRAAPVDISRAPRPAGGGTITGPAQPPEDTAPDSPPF